MNGVINYITREKDTVTFNGFDNISPTVYVNMSLSNQCMFVCIDESCRTTNSYEVKIEMADQTTHNPQLLLDLENNPTILNKAFIYNDKSKTYYSTEFPVN